MARAEIFSGLVDEMVAGAGEQKLLELLEVKDGKTNYPPDYNGFPVDQYFSPGLILPYSSARGCYWHKCAFCPEKSEGNAYLPLEVSQVRRTTSVDPADESGTDSYSGQLHMSVTAKRTGAKSRQTLPGMALPGSLTLG